MAQSNMSGPLVVTDSVTASSFISSGGTIGSTTLNISGKVTAGSLTWTTGTADHNGVASGTVTGATLLRWAQTGATGGTANSSGVVVAETVNALDLAWATATATGGTADSATTRAAAVVGVTSVAWGTATATGGTATSAGIVVKETLNALDMHFGTTTATGGTFAAAGNTVGAALDVNGALTGASVVSDTYLTSTSGTIYWSSVLQRYAAASAAWNDATVYNPGDIIWNQTPASGSAVGWICTTLGTGTGATFVGFGSIW